MYIYICIYIYSHYVCSPGYISMCTGTDFLIGPIALTVHLELQGPGVVEAGALVLHSARESSRY